MTAQRLGGSVDEDPGYYFLLTIDSSDIKLKALMAGFRKSALISVKIEYG